MKSKKILLVGGGGHCLSCIDVIEQDGRFDIVGIIDEGKGADEILGYPIFGGDAELQRLRKDYSYALITIGQIRSPVSRMQVHEKLLSLDYKLPIIISPRAYVSKHAVIRSGTIVMPGALINAGASVGINCIVNCKSLIEHEAIVGDHCHISTGAVINGGVVVGSGTFVGSNATVKEMAKIGENQFIRAGKLYTGGNDE